MKSKDELFDPSNVAINNGQFAGLPFDYQHSKLVIVPFPWDVTTSGRPGTSLGPQNMLEQSLQIDLGTLNDTEIWRQGIYTLTQNENTLSTNYEIRKLANEIIAKLESGDLMSESLKENLLLINKSCSDTIDHYKSISVSILNDNKIPVIFGGDHSCALANIRACHQFYPDLSILHFDAHLDMREAYESMVFSHASVFYNILEELDINTLVSVGIRDFARKEVEFSKTHENVHILAAKTLFFQLYEGEKYSKIIRPYIEKLGDEVYISLDLDVLCPELCPSSGTPTPGGLSYFQILFFVEEIVKSGRRIVGLDICECGGESYIDGFTAAKMLFELSVLCLRSNNFSKT